MDDEYMSVKYYRSEVIELLRAVCVDCNAFSRVHVHYMHVHVQVHVHCTDHTNYDTPYNLRRYTDHRYLIKL